MMLWWSNVHQNCRHHEQLNGCSLDVNHCIFVLFISIIVFHWWNATFTNKKSYQKIIYLLKNIYISQSAKPSRPQQQPRSNHLWRSAQDDFKFSRPPNSRLDAAGAPTRRHSWKHRLSIVRWQLTFSTRKNACVIITMVSFSWYFMSNKFNEVLVRVSAKIRRKTIEICKSSTVSAISTGGDAVPAKLWFCEKCNVFLIVLTSVRLTSSSNIGLGWKFHRKTWICKKNPTFLI